MSIVLDSPMEALAIHGVLTAVNNVWAWIAFLTAAISFWKIKSSIHPSPHHLSLQLSPPPPPSPPQPVADQPETPSTSARSASITSSKKHTSFCTLENRKSGKFSVYYTQNHKTKDDDRIDSEFEEVIDSDRSRMSSIRCNDEEEVKMMSSIRCNGEDEVKIMRSTSARVNYRENISNGWELVLKMKKAEMGWYLYQDLTVLDGNVVRLWN